MIMNRTIYGFLESCLLLAGGCVAGLCGCTNDAFTEPDAKDRNSLCIESVWIGNGQAQTRTAGYTLLAAGDMGVFLTNASGVTTYPTKDNLLYSYAGGSWQTIPSLFLNPDNAEVCAYYPYNAAYTNSGAIPLQSGVYAAENDLGYAVKKTVNNNVPQNSFAMQRAYAKLTLILKRGNVKDDCTVSSIVLGATDKPGVKKSNTLNIATGTYGTAVAADNNKLVYSTNIALVKGGASVSCDYLLVPTTVSGGLPVSFMLNGRERTVSVVVGSFITLAAGTHYTVTLSINGTSAVVTGATITAWTKDNAINNSGSAFPIM